MASPRPSDPFAAIDRLACGAGFIPDETVDRALALQAAARHATADGPLARTIVEALLSHRHDRIALLTGFVLPDAFPCGENDGPLGTVALARALDRAGFDVAVYADPPAVDSVTWLAAEIEARVPVAPIPEGPTLLSDSFDVAIAIEKPGVNAAGHLHAWDGRRIEGGSVPIDSLFDRLAAEGKATLAIGDRGNEIGFGMILNELLSLVPEARRCTCSCGAGTAAVTAADLLFPAAVSNWGAYALCAGLALAANDRSLLLLPEEEERLLNVAAVRGCRDGLLRTAAFGVDGISGSISIRVVDAMRAVVDAALGTT
jgi:hypothetical protein